MKYCYVVTCDDMISGACYHDLKNHVMVLDKSVIMTYNILIVILIDEF